MWAYTLTAPMRLERLEVETPSQTLLEPGEVLLRFLAGGICGSDLPRFRGAHAGAPSARGRILSRAELGFGTPGYPLHEVVGEVVASRSDLEVGERVVGWADGVRGLSEYLITAADALAPVTAKLDNTRSVVIQPLACVLYALGRIPAISGARTAVIGLGPMGLLFSHGLKSLGAASVTAVDRVDRSDVAAFFGVDRFLHSPSREWAVSISDRDRPQLIIETVGHQVGTLNDAIEASAHGGHIFYFGIPDDPYYPVAFNAFLRKDLTLQAGSTRGRRAALTKADAHMTAHPGLADALVTHALPVTDVQEAFCLANAPTSGQVKIVIHAGDPSSHATRSKVGRHD